MKSGPYRSEYVRELNDFYDALDEVQDGLLRMAKSVSAAEFRPELNHRLEQMRELGCRLERIYFLVNQESLRIVCRTADEVKVEFDEILELKLRNTLSVPKVGRNGTNLMRGVQKVHAVK